MHQTLAGKVVWITGASSGIGRALAAEAARRGARLILSGRNEGALRETAVLCGGYRTAKALADGAPRLPADALLPFDLADPGARRKAAQEALVLFDRIDTLVLNAGVSQRARFAETSPEVFDLIMQTNFGAAVDLTRAVLPQMRDRDSGMIICISSIAGLMGAPWRTAYSASKHAQAGFFSSLRAELYGSGIHIAMVYPGFVRTSISENALSGDGARHGELDPLQKSGQEPSETARIVWDKLETGALDIKVAFDFKAHLGVFLARYFPKLFVRSISKHGGL
ncbi:Oxidoreductase, short chain dehydrogenase [uncultured spirochete]|jgi:short-subunit dehydrogenase|uniref:Oxidoreductase, short chain dehydrogenase n=1 Tax=uncultured spirochete TaxID=156406 RepID=A0A3P3XT12_9SPIR|nr:Oxidoreductase, short chain dehydrogenase [uncultured spirochete]